METNNTIEEIINSFTSMMIEFEEMTDESEKPRKRPIYIIDFMRHNITQAEITGARKYQEIVRKEECTAQDIKFLISVNK